MFAYIIKRLLSGVIVVILVSMAVFALFWYGPSSPARPICLAETGNRCTPERLENYEEQLGYNNNIVSEYGNYAKGIFTGREMPIGNVVIDCDRPCLGFSHRSRALVWDELIERLPATVSVAVGGAFLYLALGIPIGVAAARRRGTLGDKLLVSSFLFLSSVPYYLFALLAWLYFTLIWQVPILGSSGYTPITDNPAEWAKGLLLPWLCLGIFGCTQYTRYTRGAMVETLSEDYIRTAKAKGVGSFRMLVRHCLRGGIIPAVAFIGPAFAGIVSGSVVIESVFAMPGLGMHFIKAIEVGDAPVILGIVMLYGTLIIIANFLTDLLGLWLNPRLRKS